MTSKERVYKRLKGEKVDKIPNASITMGLVAKEAGVSYRQYATDFKYLVEGNVRLCEKYGIDFVSAISDPMREAEGFGAKVSFPEDGVPFCREPFLQEYSDIKKLSVKDPSLCERMSDRIKACEAFKSEVGEEYPIVGWVEGAFAEAADLRGVSQLMMDMYDNEVFVRELLDITEKQAILFAKSQIEAGADIIGIGDAATSLIGPQLYEEFALEHQKNIIKAVHEMGAIAKLHICGNISRVLDLVRETEADIIDVDHMVDFENATRVLNGFTVSGNFDPVEIMLHGSTEDVKNAVKHCINVSDNKCFIAAGCEVPTGTSVENLLALNEALYIYGGI